MRSGLPLKLKENGLSGILVQKFVLGIILLASEHRRNLDSPLRVSRGAWYKWIV